jgi:hypothetical protein
MVLGIEESWTGVACALKGGSGKIIDTGFSVGTFIYYNDAL